MTDLGAQAKLSIGEASLSALADIKLELGEMRGDFQKLHKALLRTEDNYQVKGPVQLQLRGNATSPASGNFGFGVAGPKYGRKWEIRRLLVGGLLYSTTVGGTAEIYVTSLPSNQSVNNRNLADMVDQAASLPSVAFYSAGQFTLRHPQELHVVIVTPTATTTYVVTGSGFDLPDDASPGVFTE